MAAFSDGAVMPAEARMSAEGVPLAMASASSRRSAVNIAVARLLGDLLGAVEEPCSLRRHIDLAGAAALDLGQLGELALHAGKRPLRVAPRSTDEIGSEAFVVLQQDLQQMLRRKALMAAAQRQPLRRLNEAPRTLGILLEDPLFALLRPRPGWARSRRCVSTTTRRYG